MLTAILLALGTYLAIAGGLWAAQERLIFLPDQRPLAAAGPFALGRLRTPDGLDLAFLHAPPRAPAAPVILYFQGNGGQAADRAGALTPVVARGAGVVIAGYRGYGGNPGAPSEAGLRRDAAAHLAWLRARHPGAPVVLWGESLGGALATQLAREDPAGVVALVLDSPFTSIAKLAQAHYPWLPVRALLRHAFESEAALAALRLPVLILHADGDAVVPAAHGRRMLAVAQAAGAPAEALFLPGGAHPAVLNGGPAPMAAALRFLDRVAPAR
ncbi:alpha/beta hydrolase [Roseicella aerolata]|uniref:Alpha/beta hydrolase n=1 Tax=Roseicella aerolata TaxID=2883479 RepID=A0A9X1IIH2_9PROT|nr:alpha/beta fold hydrolase [Roseicella aerolata]MCB4825270.1 alpha/beta hydrolase [Roseicella aerolata]